MDALRCVAAGHGDVNGTVNVNVDVDVNVEINENRIQFYFFHFIPIQSELLTGDNYKLLSRYRGMIAARGRASSSFPDSSVTITWNVILVFVIVFFVFYFQELLSQYSIYLILI